MLKMLKMLKIRRVARDECSDFRLPTSGRTCAATGQEAAPAYGERNGVPGELLVRVTPQRVTGRWGVAE